MVLRQQAADILARLDVELLHASAGALCAVSVWSLELVPNAHKFDTTVWRDAVAGDSGWDIFSLHYKLTSPVNTVINEAAMTQYQRIFHFLWRLKRVEHALSGSWSKDMNLGHLVQVRRVALGRGWLAIIQSRPPTLCVCDHIHRLVVLCVCVGTTAEHRAAHSQVPAPSVRDDPLHCEPAQLHDV